MSVAARARLRRLGRPAATLALVLALLAGGAVLGFTLAGSSTTETRLGRVSLELEPSLRGSASAFIPLADWGFEADAFDAPFGLRAELRSIRREALLRAAEGDSTVLAATEEELGDAAQAAVLRGLGWALGAALVLLVVATMALPRLRPRWILLALGAPLGLLAAAATGFAAQASFDARAFESPTYFARGAELARILEVAEDERVSSEYGSTFASILRSVGAVLTETGPEQPTRDLYLASDLHGNPLVVGPLARYVGEAPVLFVGDIGQRGGEAEAAALAPRIAALGERVIAVSGNHDSSTLMRRLAESGVSVLGAERIAGGAGDPEDPLLDLDGLLVAGFPDPLEWRGRGDPEERPVTFEELDDPEAAFGAALEDLVEWFDSLPRRPEIVLVHQNGLAQALAGELNERGAQPPLTIATGHDHAQHVDRYGDVVVVDGGSVGAGGLFGAGEEAIGLAGLHFDPLDGELRSVDLIRAEPFSGQAQAARVVIDSMCPEDDVCRFEPGPLAASPAGG